MGLSFLTPALLAGAALVAVPVILHLIMRRKPVPRTFPAMRFLRQRAAANRRRLRVSHLFLLLLRMAALAGLALALARPTLRGAGWLADGEKPVAAVLVFDTNPRMELRQANRTRLQEAAALARALAAKLPAASQVAVIDTGGGPVSFSPTVAAALTRVDRLAVGTASQTLPAAMQEGFRLLATLPDLRHELVVFTDCSQGAWEGRTAADLVSANPDTAILWVDVGAKAAQNFSLEAIDLSTDQPTAGLALGLTVETRRSGPDANRPVAVEMLGADGRYARRAVKPVTWKEGPSGQVEFEVTGLEPGVRQGRVVLDGSDDMEADNTRFFTVEVGTPSKILVAAPQPAADTGRFLLQAIAPAALRKAGKGRFDATLIDIGKLDATPWDGYEGMVLADPPPLTPRTLDLLWQWVAGGRGLVVWLGPRAADAGRFNSDAARKLLGGRIVRVWRNPREDNFLAPANLDHPILGPFRRVGDAVPWQDFPIERLWEFEPNDPADGAGPGPGGDGLVDSAIPVMTYRNGLPAILEHRVGQGTVVTVTTPVSQSADDPDAWNMLATGFEPWPFVILANETLLHAIDTADDRNIVAGASAVLHLQRRDVATAFVSTPGGDDFPAPVDQRRGTVTVTTTQVPGNYRVRSGGDVGGIVRGFSSNLGADGIDARRLADAGLVAALGAGYRLAQSEAELVRDVRLERVGAELSGWFILLAALVMAADWIVANRFYAPRDDAGFAGLGAGPSTVQKEPPPLPGGAGMAVRGADA
ncbi:MAG: BatA domain-containing protein [Planctomycetia bacterium]|jgi:hypothetical protein